MRKARSESLYEASGGLFGVSGRASNSLQQMGGGIALPGLTFSKKNVYDRKNRAIIDLNETTGMGKSGRKSFRERNRWRCEVPQERDCDGSPRSRRNEAKRFV